MSDDEAAFLARIREDPDADLPRLVFADWLQEQGHEARAHFIRAQIELATLTEDSPRRRELAWHCRQIVEPTGRQWHDAPREFAGSSEHLAKPFAFARPRLVRGLIEYAEFWLETPSGIRAAFHIAPLRRVWLYEPDEIAGLIAAIPADNTLRTLDLTGNPLTADLLHEIPAAVRLPRLTELVLIGCELTDDAVRVLCERPQYRDLRKLHLGGNPFIADGRARLRDHFGDRVTFDYDRDPDWLYAFDEIDSDLSVGVGNNLTQHLVTVGYTGVRIAEFDHAGNVLRLEAREHEETRHVEPIRKSLLNELGHTPATIRVKRFQFKDGTGITPFVPFHMEELDDSNSAERDSERRWFADWLDDGKFRWQWGPGRDWWLNGDGQVTDT